MPAHDPGGGIQRELARARQACWRLVAKELLQKLAQPGLDPAYVLMVLEAVLADPDKITARIDHVALLDERRHLGLDVLELIVRRLREILPRERQQPRQPAHVISADAAPG